MLGTSGFQGVAGDITIRSNLTKEEYTNTSAYTVGENGVTLTFQCVVAGATNVQASETFTIVEAPEEITGLSTSSPGNIDIGRNPETDTEYRIRFRNAKAANSKATRNANISNLIPYVDNEKYLNIIDKKNDPTMNAGEIEIIAKHNTTDEIFANVILNTVADGIDYIGNTTVVLQDDAGQNVTVTFYKADEIGIDFEITGSVKNGYVQNTVFENAKKAILNYTQNTHIFGLNSLLFATEFIVPVLQTEGMATVTSIKIKRSTDENYSDSIQLTKFEVPVFAITNIEIQGVS